MTDQSVFDDIDKIDGGKPATPADTPASPAPSGDVFSDQLKAIQNERGEQKYESVQKALEALQHSQNYIPELKGQLEAKDKELSEMREAMSKVGKMEELVEKLTASQGTSTTPEAALDEQRAAALFEQLLEKRDTAKSLASNKETVHNSLIEKFGSAEAANKAVIEKAAELGTTAGEMGKLASQNPKMVLALFGSTKPAPSGSPPASSVSSDSFLSRKVEEEGLKRPSKSLLSGATYKEQLEYFKAVRDDVYKRHNVTT